MIKKLYECDCFDYERFIVSNQKELLLNPSSAVLLTLMLKEYKNNKYFSVESLKDKISIDDKEFDFVVTNLLERQFYSIYVEYEDGIGKEAISLDGFFDRVKEVLEGKNSKDLDNDFFYVVQYIQKEINRVLTPVEMEIVSSLITEDGIKIDEIKDALAYMKDHYKVLSIKNLVTSINRYRNEAKEEVEEVPDFVKDFLNNIK